MYYEINVSLDGKHFFATDKRSLTHKAQMEKVYKILKEKFPISEGYDILVSKVEVTGIFVDTNYMDNQEQE
jgi:hypothetical protein